MSNNVPDRILIINLGGIGDALLSTPSIRALKDLYPQARISVLTSRSAAEVFRRLGYISDVSAISVGYGARWSFAEALNDYRILSGLRSRRFDMALNMRTLYSDFGALKMKAMLALIAPKRTAGRDTDGRGAFFDVRVPEKSKADKYEMEYDIAMVEALGGKVTDRSVDLAITEDDRHEAAKFLDFRSVTRADMLVGIHPGGKPSRRLPPDIFVRAAKILHDKVSCKFVITGGKDEHELAGQLIGESGIPKHYAMNAAGKLSLGGTAALIGRCDLYVSNDTANMHIAAILGTPLVAVFGPGDLTRFDPRNISSRAAVIYHKTECAPCEKMVCNDKKCFKAVTPEEIAVAASELIQKTGLNMAGGMQG